MCVCVCVCFSVGLSLDYKDCFCRDGVGSHDSAVDSDVHKPKHPAARVLEQKVLEDSHSQSISRVSGRLTSLQLCRLCVCFTLCVCVCVPILLCCVCVCLIFVCLFCFVHLYFYRLCPGIPTPQWTGCKTPSVSLHSVNFFYVFNIII